MYHPRVIRDQLTYVDVPERSQEYSLSYLLRPLTSFDPSETQILTPVRPYPLNLRKGVWNIPHLGTGVRVTGVSVRWCTQGGSVGRISFGSWIGNMEGSYKLRLSGTSIENKKN